MNRQNRNRQRKEKKLNKLIRELCCWNCFQFGHKRFQCPYPKQTRCSFCRKPSVLSVECGCDLSQENLVLIEPQVVNEIANYDQNVMVPVNQPNGEIEYQQNENLVFILGNDNLSNEEIDHEGDDILEIHAETDSLDDL